MVRGIHGMAYCWIDHNSGSVVLNKSMEQTSITRQTWFKAYLLYILEQETYDNFSLEKASMTEWGKPKRDLDTAFNQLVIASVNANDKANETFLLTNHMSPITPIKMLWGVRT